MTQPSNPRKRWRAPRRRTRRRTRRRPRRPFLHPRLWLPDDRSSAPSLNLEISSRTVHSFTPGGHRGAGASRAGQCGRLGIPGQGNSSCCLSRERAVDSGWDFCVLVCLFTCGWLGLICLFRGLNWQHWEESEFKTLVFISEGRYSGRRTVTYDFYKEYY